MLDEKLIEEINQARETGKTIGLVQGSWDLFHVGHLKYIMEAKKQCDFLIVALDSDEKIRKRKGKYRPVIPETEREELLKKLGELKLEDCHLISGVVIKGLGEPKWGLIKSVKPDVLIAIKENYSDEEIEKLEEICGKVAILPRQSESSTSDKIRKIMISERQEITNAIDEQLIKSIESIKARTGFNEEMGEPLTLLFEHLKESTDSVSPVAVGCFLKGKWYLGSNQIDLRLPKYDIENRTKLFYSTVEYSAMNLMKQLGDFPVIDSPIWTTLFPDDRSMRVFYDRGVREIYYLEDHPEKNWSKRSHVLAEEYGIKTKKIIKTLESVEETPNANEQLIKSIEDMKQKFGLNGELSEPLSKLLEYLKESDDLVTPVAAGCYWNDKWYFGTNKYDKNVSDKDKEKRTELFYDTTEHAEINLLKKLGDVEVLNTPIWVTLFPCDRCMKVLNDKGVKEIFYLEDHPEKNWSKRSHALAEKWGIKATQVLTKPELDVVEEKKNVMISTGSFKYIDPNNVRSKTQLEIMLRQEALDKDPLDPNVIDQEILFTTDHWYVSRNRFPYDEIEHQFLIISKNSIYNVDNMSKEMWIDLRNIWAKLLLDFDINGGALCYRFGNTLLSGASLKRLHAHLVVPKKGLKTKFTIGGNLEPKNNLVLKP